MDKLLKIEEAQAYLDQMQQVCDQPEEFDSYLHNFYAATQAILQDIGQEVQTKPWHIWYENSKENSGVFAFFADKKNLAHHVTTSRPPVKEDTEDPNRKTATDSLSFVEKISNWINQLLTPEEASQPDQNPQPSEKGMNIFHFDTWPGEERALSICRNYLYEITHIVKEGQSLAYIS